MTHTLSLDALSAAVHHVRQEYGDYGYSIGVAGSYFGGGIIEVHHSDGSQFWLAVDRHGNTPRRLCDKGDYNVAGENGIPPMYDYLCADHAAGLVTAT